MFVMNLIRVCPTAGIGEDQLSIKENQQDQTTPWFDDDNLPVFTQTSSPGSTMHQLLSTEEPPQQMEFSTEIVNSRPPAVVPGYQVLCSNSRIGRVSASVVNNLSSAGSKPLPPSTAENKYLKKSLLDAVDALNEEGGDWF
jgi:hypothetical protein